MKEQKQLDENIKKVLAASKGKIVALNKDIEDLSVENENLTSTYEASENEKKELQQKTIELGTNLKKLNAHNEQLLALKNKIALEYKLEKDTIAKLNDEAEIEKAKFNKEMEELIEEDRRLVALINIEKQEFNEFHKSSEKRVDGLTISLQKKEDEIEHFKKMLNNFNEKDNTRKQELEYEDEEIIKLSQQRSKSNKGYR